MSAARLEVGIDGRHIRRDLEELFRVGVEFAVTDAVILIAVRAALVDGLIIVVETIGARVVIVFLRAILSERQLWPIR